jgi:hypothetical protein
MRKAGDYVEKWTRFVPLFSEKAIHSKGKKELISKTNHLWELLTINICGMFCPLRSSNGKMN